MRKKKLLSWVLSLVMALTVFSIPTGTFAVDDDENSPNYRLGYFFYDEEDDEVIFVGISDGGPLNFSDIGRKYYYICSDEHGTWDYAYDVKKIVLQIDKPESLGVKWYDQETEDTIVSTSAETTVAGNSFSFVPLKAAEDINVNISFYDDTASTEPITSIQFTVSVSENDLPQYRLECRTYDSETGEYSEQYINNGDNVAFSTIGYDNDFAAVVSDEDGEWQYFRPEKTVWTNDAPGVVRLMYNDATAGHDVISTSTETVVLDGESVCLVPRKPGPASISVAIYNEATDEEPVATIAFTAEVGEDDVTHYRLGWRDYDTDDLVLATEDPFDYASMGNVGICVYSDVWGTWENPWPPKMVWHVSTPELAKLRYHDDKNDKYQTAGADFELNKDTSDCVFIVPVSEGIAEFSVDVYDNTNETEPIATIPLSIQITQEGLDRAKYEPYLCEAYASEADFDTQKVYGYIGNLAEYKEEYKGEYPEITAEDLDKLQIEVEVGGNTYNAAINRNNYSYSAKFSNAKPGAKVKVTYKMGTYSTTENLIVTQWINPKVTVKSYTYNGKSHNASITVTYKGKTLKKGTDYYAESGTIKNVGRTWYSVWDADNSEYKFSNVEGYFKVNPKGTSVKNLKKAKKAFTVTWGKQATKMSKARITGYQIQLATNSKFTKNKKTVTVKGYKNTSKKITKLKKKTKYYVKIRTYMKVGKITYYSDWSKVKTVKTK